MQEEVCAHNPRKRTHARTHGANPACTHPPLPTLPPAGRCCTKTPAAPAPGDLLAGPLEKLLLLAFLLPIPAMGLRTRECAPSCAYSSVKLKLIKGGRLECHSSRNYF